MRAAVALLAGGLFGLGLTISDMIDPARVLAFLDVTSGAWDPTLAFVMGGAMIPMLIAWRVAKGLSRPAVATDFPQPARREIDASLLGGAALFGGGWGLVGFCPGPALSALGLGGAPVWIFVAALVVGNLLPSLPFGARPRLA